MIPLCSEYEETEVLRSSELEMMLKLKYLCIFILHYCFSFWVFVFSWKFPKSFEVLNAFWKNIPLLSEGRIRSCPYEQVLSILVLVSNCKLGSGGCLWSKGRLLIPVLDICGTCCLVLEWASWLFVLEFHLPSSLVNSNRKLLFFLL